MDRVIITLLLLLSSLGTFAQNQNVSNGNVFEGEPYLSINPNNPQHLVVAWMGWTNLSNRFKIKVKSSFDGGQTWSTAYELPHTVAGYSSADPSIDFNNNGNVYVCYIDFTGTTPPVTGGVFISKSTDGGLSWGVPMEVIDTDYDGTKWPIDRPWMVIDKSTGANQGNIYVTSMNLNRTNSPFSPYLSVSSDGGNTFTTQYLDTMGWLAGSLNPLPMCSPAMSSSGTFHGAYPSYVFTQNPNIQVFLASSSDGGSSISHNTILTYPTGSFPSEEAKKAHLLISNPTDLNHLAFIYFSSINGDMDVYLTESLNAGGTWTSPIRINDDPIGNNRMQDLVWGDFDTDGDLIISWRDRRNGTDSTYQTQSEIWAAYRNKDSIQFEPNFQITDQTVAFDSILESAGNDFMCIKMKNDTLNAVWGDTRNGKLNIWFQRMATNGMVLSVQQISSEQIPEILIYPNPTTSIVTIENKSLRTVNVYDFNGKKIMAIQNENELEVVEINVESLPSGTYLIEAKTSKGIYTKKMIKN